MTPLFVLELYEDEWLRVMRSRLELTQGALAKRLGVARQTVSYYENGILKVSQEHIAQIRRMAEETV